MKKFKLLGLFAILTFIMSNALYAQGSFILKAEADLSGKLTVAKSGFERDFDTKTSFALSAEYMMSPGQFSLGVGGSYLLPRGLDEAGLDDDENTFGFIPIYGVVKFNLMPGELVPQVIGHVGYDFFTASDTFKGRAELSGGIYWAAGAGVEIGQIVVTGMYKVFNGSLSEGGREDDFTHKTFSLGAGFAF